MNTSGKQKGSKKCLFIPRYVMGVLFIPVVVWGPKPKTEKVGWWQRYGKPF